MFSYKLLGQNNNKSKDTPPETNSDQLCDDIWIKVFSKLEPWFLNSVLRTSQRFHQCAKSNVIFSKKFETYSLSGWSLFSKGEKSEYNKSYELFAQNYKAKFFNNARARKFAACILEGDIDELLKIPFNIDLLYEKDVNGTDILTYINKQNNQKLRDIIFQHALHHNEDNKTNIILYACMQVINFTWSMIGKPSINERLYQLAAALNQPSIIKMFTTTNNFNSIDPPSYYHSIPLELAVRFNHSEIVSCLLNSGLPYLYDIYDHFYPIIREYNHLAKAAFLNHIEIVRLLMQHYGNQFRGYEISNAVCAAAYAGHADIVEILVSHGSAAKGIENPYEIACGNGHLAALRVLIAHFHTLFPNQAEKYQILLCNLFHMAVEKNHADIVAYLFSKIENVKKLIEHSDTYFLLVSDYNSDQANMYRTLLDQGFSPSAGCLNWLFVSSCNKKHTDILCVLIEHNLQPQAEYRDKVQALMSSLGTSQNHAEQQSARLFLG